MTLLATESKSKLLPTDAPLEAIVTVAGYFYHVDFVNAVDIGSGNRSQAHRVGKDRRCTCYKGASCPAVTAVAEYLRSGGERAPDPPPGYYPVAPLSCPVCSAPTVFDNRLSSKRRGAGWRCIQGGSLHYWEAQVQVLRQKLAENPWLFPPVVIRNGAQILAHDGILDGDTVLYPGVLRAEIVSYSDSP
jgi:hypothetical protein